MQEQQHGQRNDRFSDFMYYTMNQLPCNSNAVTNVDETWL